MSVVSSIEKISFPTGGKKKKRKKVVHVCVVKNVKNFSSERTEKRKSPFNCETTLTQEKFPAAIAFELTPLYFT